MKNSRKYQYLILNQEGFILQSNENLFLTKEISWETSERFITFYQNIFPFITEALQTKKIVTFKAINTPSHFLPGTYDFIFSLKENNLDASAPLIECWINDRTEYYRDTHQFLQSSRKQQLTISQ